MDSLKHCEKRLPLKLRIVLEKELILTQILKDLRPQAFNCASETTHIVQLGCFFVHYSLATAMTN